MKSINLSGFPRESVGKKDSRTLRAEGKVPCVIYGGGEQVHFWAFGYDLKSILYTPNTYIVEINFGSKNFRTVVKESQYHPISEGILHVDFLELDSKKAVSVEVPINFDGSPVGLRVGGKFISRLRNLTVRALPNDLPDYVNVDVSDLELGKAIKVREVEAKDFIILNAPNNPICQVIVPRAAKTEEEEAAEAAEAAEEEEGEEGEEEATEE